MRSRHFITVVSLIAAALTACSDQQDTVSPSVRPSRVLGVPLRPPPSNPNDFVAITAGASHTCAMRRNGKLYCWGLDDHGQLGIGPAPVICGGPTGSQCAIRPTQVLSPTFSAAFAVSAGYNHTCALDLTYQGAFCWGATTSPWQVGGVNTPTAVPGGLVFQSISAGMFATCGASSGSIYCWGTGGAVPGGSQSTPTVVFNHNGVSTVFTSVVSVGDDFACGAGNTNSGANIFCYGGNSVGQSGNPSLQTVAPFGSVSLSMGTKSVSAGSSFACADDASGIVECWGANDRGQLGAPSFTANSSFVPLAAGSDVNGGTLRLHGVSAGSSHACALDNSGQAFCWGWNEYGEVGSGAFETSVRTAIPVSAPVAFRAIAAGGQHTCAIGTDNGIYCWGDNYLGQLGIGSVTWTGQWTFSTVQRAVDPPL